MRRLPDGYATQSIACLASATHFIWLFFSRTKNGKEQLAQSHNTTRLTCGQTHPVTPATRNACSTSAADGVVPSTPPTPGNSSIDVTTARATARQNRAPPQCPRLFCPLLHQRSFPSGFSAGHLRQETPGLVPPPAPDMHSQDHQTGTSVWLHRLWIRPCLPPASCLKSDSVNVGDTSPGPPT